MGKQTKRKKEKPKKPYFRNKTLNHIFKRLLWILSFTLIASCGSTSYQDGSTSGPSSPPPSNPDGGDNGGGSGITGALFEITGAQGSHPVYQSEPFSTDSILRISVGTAPGVNIPVSTSYGCEQFRITARHVDQSTGPSQLTPVMKVEGRDNSLCPNAPSSTTIDFSQLAGGTSDIVVEVSEGYYDWRCKYVYPWFCPMAPVYTTHGIRGVLDIQINGGSQF